MFLLACFAVTSYPCKANTKVFVILLQLLRESKFDDDIIVIIKVKASKFDTFEKIQFTHLQQYDVFSLQEYDVTVKKADKKVTMHA